MNLPSCPYRLENGDGGIVKVHLNSEVVDRNQNAFPFDHLKQLDGKNIEVLNQMRFVSLNMTGKETKQILNFP